MGNHDNQHDTSAGRPTSPRQETAAEHYGGDDGALEHEGGQLAAPAETAQPARTLAQAAQEQQAADLATGRENAG
jgi:hypothetical protein